MQNTLDEVANRPEAATANRKLIDAGRGLVVKIDVIANTVAGRIAFDL